jgi:hypothetical protein
MRRLRKFFRLNPSNRKLLFKTWLLVVAVRLGLWVLPLKHLRRLLSPWTEREPSHFEANRILFEKLAWIVERASRYVPGARTCLVQALAVQVILARKGYPAGLRLGVSREGAEGIQAHAWVESNGMVVVGGADLDRYEPLTPLREEQE